MDSKNQRICVIGAGPSGLSVNVAFKMAKDAGEQIPEVVVFEKQETILGLWNYTWKTGVDTTGEPIHNSMYDLLYTNAAKEMHEYSYYTHMDHWGKPTPSFPPRAGMRSYLEARFTKYGEPAWIQFQTVVKKVTYDEETKMFTVTTRNYSEPTEKVQQFNYVICCTGHFSYPNVASLPCYNDYTGTIMHSHDQRTFKNYKDKTVMVVGTMFSAEDIASIAYKHGAKKIVCSYRTNAMAWTWPEQFETHTLPTKIEGKTVHFQDGAQVDVDYIILCTGYKLNYPFMEQKIRLESDSKIIPEMLYKCVSFMQNNKVFYIGMPAQVYSFNMMDVQAFYARDVIMGKITQPDKAKQQEWHDTWKAKQDQFTGLKDAAQCQGDYVSELMHECNYPKTWDTNETNKVCYQWLDNKAANIMTFRDQKYTSAISKVESLAVKVPWLENFEDSVESFLNNGVE